MVKYFLFMSLLQKPYADTNFFFGSLDENVKDVSQPRQYAPFSLCFNYGSLIIFSNLALGGRFKVPDVSLHSGRCGLLLYLVQFRTLTTLGDRSFTVTAPKLWNSIRISPSLINF